AKSRTTWARISGEKTCCASEKEAGATGCGQTSLIFSNRLAAHSPRMLVRTGLKSQQKQAEIRLFGQLAPPLWGAAGRGRRQSRQQRPAEMFEQFPVAQILLCYLSRRLGHDPSQPYRRQKYKLQLCDKYTARHRIAATNYF